MKAAFGRWVVALVVVGAGPSAALANTAAVGARHSVVRTFDGTVVVWGDGSHGQLGLGTRRSSLVPVEVPGLRDVVAVAAGEYHTVVLKRDGSVWTFGRFGPEADSTVPVRVDGLTDVAAIAAGESHSLAWKLDGSAWMWGGEGKDPLTPVQVRDLPPVLAIAAGGDRSLALSFDHTVWGWSQTLSPSRGVFPGRAAGIGAGSRFDLVLDAEGRLWSSGVRVGDLSGVTAFGAGREHALAVVGEGLFAWGRATEGQLGIGSLESQTHPVRVPRPEGVAVIASGPGHHSVVITHSGEVWAWGANAHVQVGDGTRETRPEPVQLAERGFAWKVAKPVVSPAPGTFSRSQRVSVSCATPDAQIHYTTDGSEPTPESPLLDPDAPLSVDRSLDLRLKAWKAGLRPSDSVLAGYVLVVASPIFIPAGGVYGRSLTVALTTPTAGAVIRLTLDGTEPTESAAPYDGPVAVSTSSRVKARAFRKGWTASPIVTADYSLDLGMLSAPTVRPAPGRYRRPLEVLLSAAAGSTIHYTIDGSEPTLASPAYTGPFTASDSKTTVKARAFHPDYRPSSVVVAVYELEGPAAVPFTQVGTPTLSPGGGTYGAAQNVTINTTTPGATLRYTMNGVEPGVDDPPIATGTSVLVNASLTLKVKAWMDGSTPSNTAVGSYYVSLGTLAAPTFSPPGGTYAAAPSVALSAAPGATIRYTVDGTDPTLASSVYGSPIPVGVTTTIKARTYAANWTASAVASATYALDVGSVSVPTLTPGGGVYGGRQEVTVSCATPNAILRYTNTGFDPKPNDPIIASGTKIMVDRSMVLKVKAWKGLLPPSGVRRADYWITGAIAAGTYHNLAVRGEGTVWAWGSHGYGQLGDGTPADTTPRRNPVQVKTGPTSFLTDVVAVAAGGEFSLALKRDGTVWAWGANTPFGQLGTGDGGPNVQTTAVQVIQGVGVPLTDVVAIAAGSAFSLALKRDGTVWAWGSNYAGQLGIPIGGSRNTAASVPGLTGITAIAAGKNSSVALKTDGATAGVVWSWGSNASGVLGDGTNADRSTPASGISDVVSISAGDFHQLAVKTNGTVWGCGSNYYSALADGTTGTDRWTRVLAIAPSGMSSTAVGERHSLFLRGDRTVWAAGWNDYGQLGNGIGWAPLHAPATTAVQTGEWGQLTQVVAVDAGHSHSLALRIDGTVWAFGRNDYGQIGDGTDFDRETPTRVNFTPSDASWLMGDADGDGLATWRERELGTDPLNPDTNGDGILDGIAVASGMSATNPDMDGDGVLNAAERTRGTDPFRADTDGDGVGDYPDCFPLDSTRSECPAVSGDTTPPTITLTEPTNATLIPPP